MTINWLFHSVEIQECNLHHNSPGDRYFKCIDLRTRTRSNTQTWCVSAVNLTERFSLKSTGLNGDIVLSLMGFLLIILLLWLLANQQRNFTGLVSWQGVSSRWCHNVSWQIHLHEQTFTVMEKTWCIQTAADAEINRDYNLKSKCSFMSDSQPQSITNQLIRVSAGQ